MPHQCYLCSSNNADQIFNGAVAVFGDRFVGPPARAHGGMAVAALTCPALSHASVSMFKKPVIKFVSGRLNAPVPLQAQLLSKVESGDDLRVSLHDGESEVVSGTVKIVDGDDTPGAVIGPIPTHLSDEIAEMSKLVGADLDGPTIVQQHARMHTDAGFSVENDCYGCSEKPHALKLYNKITPKRDLWTRWETDPECVDNAGQLATATVIAALDCSNLWVITAQDEDLGLSLRRDDDKDWITGTHMVHFLRVPPVDIDYQIITRFLRREGRKSFSIAVLFDSDKRVYAVAEAISILIDFLPEMK